MEIASKNGRETVTMSKKIPDFTDSQIWTVQSTLNERFKMDIDVQVIDSEIRLFPHDSELTPVPGLYWEYENCHFVIFKTGQHKYRRQFFFRVHQQFGTGVEEYNELEDCIVSLLHVQADHARNEQQASETAD